MSRTGRSGDGAIQPSLGLLDMGEGFLGIIFEQVDEGHRQILTGLSLAVPLEAMPILRGDRQLGGQLLG